MSESTTPAQTPAVPLPSQEEIDAALRTLMRAWAPTVLLPGDPEPEYDEDAPYDGCECAGDDEYGETRGCNCGPGCSCDSCSYFDYARYKRCWARPDNTACGKAPTLRVVAYEMQNAYVTEPVADGASCPHTEGEPHHCTERTVYYDAGRKEQEYWYQPACSVAHAQALIAGNRSGLEYRIERWAYTPHESELPAPLPDVRQHTRAAHCAAKWAIESLDRPQTADMWFASVRENIARAAWRAAEPLERPDEDDGTAGDEVPGLVQEEPGDPWGTDEDGAAAVAETPTGGGA